MGLTPFLYMDAFADAGETQAMLLLYKEVAADYLGFRQQ
jgi:hypothetical protein